jgi:membrane protein required for colicin V production
MQPYDIFMIVVLVGATLFGAMKGMAWQMASLGSIVLSYFVALSFSEKLAPMFSAQAPWNRFLAMLVLYILSSFTVWMIFRIVAGAIDRVRLKEFDRQLGALFGAFKGALLCIAITFFAVTLSVTARGSVLKSKSGGYIAQILNKADTVMPKEIHNVLDPYIDRLERGLDPNQPNPGSGPDSSPMQDTFQREIDRGIDRAGAAVQEGLRRRFDSTFGGQDDQYGSAGAAETRGETEYRQPMTTTGWNSERAPYPQRSTFRDDQDLRDAEADRPLRRY